VLPGLVNIHAHPALEPFFRGIREDHGVSEMYMTGLYERGQAFHPDVAEMASAAEVAYCEMLLGGVTSVCDQIWPFPGWLDVNRPPRTARLRGPGFASARWRMTARHDNLADPRRHLANTRVRQDHLADAAQRARAARVVGGEHHCGGNLPRCGKVAADAPDRRGRHISSRQRRPSRRAQQWT
jgi:cytosine/adenosine deaminase-related metal-dependent hydrolase